MTITRGNLEFRPFYDIDEMNCSHEGVSVFHEGHHIADLENHSYIYIEDMDDDEFDEFLCENNLIYYN